MTGETMRVYVNTRSVEVPAGWVSYEQVAELAGPGRPDPDRTADYPPGARGQHHIIRIGQTRRGDAILTPTIGRIVHYRLSEQDATAINKRRNDAAAYARAHRSPEVAPTPGSPGATGHVAHVGNPATAGDVCPAVIVRVFHPDAVNLQVLLDGTDTFWATSPHEGDGDGEWMWPPRV